MTKFYGPDDGTQPDEKRCAICGTIDKKENLSFKKTVNGPVKNFNGKEYQIPCWVCSECS